MKKLNMLEPGAKMLSWGIIFILIIPAGIYFISLIFKLNKCALINLAIKISVFTGVMILLALAILVGIELKQDRRLISYYEKRKSIKSEAAEGYYECQNCGNRRLKKDDRYCLICGKTLS